MARMIFHAPYPLDPQAKSASGIRPVRMRQAFVKLGYQVFDLTGTPAQRKRRLRALRTLIRQGVEFDFCYSESATIPNAVAGKKHFPPHPLLDADVFATCKRAGIPAGVFYRDIYWAFPDYVERVGWPLATAMRGLYLADLVAYRCFLKKVFLPSLHMGEHIPVVPAERFEALPPGGETVDLGGAEYDGERNLELLYIGGLGGHYQLGKAVRAVEGLHGVRLTICTSSQCWNKARKDIGNLPDNVRVVHESGAGLIGLYKVADVCMLFVEPHEYWDFAVPVKLFEYVGHGKPVICSQGIFPESFVRSEGVGWVIGYEVDQLRSLIKQLISDPNLVAAVRNHVRSKRELFTWEARANQAAQALAECRV